jgi:23S rRNA-/tRNA-specific pseudouridylate synthase
LREIPVSTFSYRALESGSNDEQARRKTAMTAKPSTPTAETAFSFVVAPQEAGTRLDRYLAERAEIAAAHVSRTRVKALLEAGAASLNGRPARDASAKLSEGDQIALRVPEPEPAPRRASRR